MAPTKPIQPIDRLPKASLRQLREGEQHLDAPSLTEQLTIELCGYPRTYHLNDGLEPDLVR